MTDRRKEQFFEAAQSLHIPLEEAQKMWDKFESLPEAHKYNDRHYQQNY